jgi:hypothetical protein
VTFSDAGSTPAASTTLTTFSIGSLIWSLRVVYLRCPIDRLVRHQNVVVPRAPDVGIRVLLARSRTLAKNLHMGASPALSACTNNRQSRGRPRKRKGAQNKLRPSYLFSADLFSAELLQFVVTNRRRRLAHWTADLPPDESGYVQRFPESVCPRIRKLRVTAGFAPRAHRAGR